MEELESLRKENRELKILVQSLRDGYTMRHNKYLKLLYRLRDMSEDISDILRSESDDMEVGDL